MLDHARHSIGEALPVKRLPVPALFAVIGVGALTGALLALLRPGMFEGRAPVREITLSMRDYTFGGTNPTLYLKPGERVRFVVRNDEDTPIKHNFEIPGLGVPPGKEIEPGGSREIMVVAPLSGEFTYGCATHRGMEGKIIIRTP
jgi:plastocyanin